MVLSERLLNLQNRENPQRDSVIFVAMLGAVCTFWHTARSRTSAPSGLQFIAAVHSARRPSLQNRKTQQRDSVIFVIMLGAVCTFWHTALSRNSVPAGLQFVIAVHSARLPNPQHRKTLLRDSDIFVAMLGAVCTFWHTVRSRSGVPFGPHWFHDALPN